MIGRLTRLYASFFFCCGFKSCIFFYFMIYLLALKNLIRSWQHSFGVLNLVMPDISLYLSLLLQKSIQQFLKEISKILIEVVSVTLSLSKTGLVTVLVILFVPMPLGSLVIKELRRGGIIKRRTSKISLTELNYPIFLVMIGVSTWQLNQIRKFKVRRMITEVQ